MWECPLMSTFITFISKQSNASTAIEEMYTFDLTRRHNPVSYIFIPDTILILDLCRGRKRSRACSFLPILCIITFIILLGVSSWALFEGIHNLDHVVSDAWVIAVDVQAKVGPHWRYHESFPSQIYVKLHKDASLVCIVT